MGALKLNNFISWDIDGDARMDRSAYEHFKPDGEGTKMLKEAGINVNGHSSQP